MRIFMGRDAELSRLKRRHDNIIAIAVGGVIGAGQGAEAVFGVFFFGAKPDDA